MHSIKTGIDYEIIWTGAHRTCEWPEAHLSLGSKRRTKGVFKDQERKVDMIHRPLHYCHVRPSSNVPFHLCVTFSILEFPDTGDWLFSGFLNFWHLRKVLQLLSCQQWLGCKYNRASQSCAHRVECQPNGTVKLRWFHEIIPGSLYVPCVFLLDTTTWQ